MALTVVELKQTKKQLEEKEAEKAKAEQAAYGAGMTKAVESLTAQLRDVTQAFYLEVWGQALNVAGVSTKLELKALDKVYYPPTLRLAPSPPQPIADPSSAPTSSLNQLASTSSATLAKGKEKEQPPLTTVVDVETEEITEVTQLKNKKKENEQEKK